MVKNNKPFKITECQTKVQLGDFIYSSYICIAKNMSRRGLDLNVLSKNLVFDRTKWRHLIHVAHPISWVKALVTVVVSYRKKP